MSNSAAAAAGPGPVATMAELETRWRRDRSSLVRMAKRGELPGAFKAGRDWRIPLATIEAIERGERPGGTGDV